MFLKYFTKNNNFTNFQPTKLSQNMSFDLSIPNRICINNSREGDEKKEKTGCRPIGRISHEH